MARTYEVPVVIRYHQHVTIQVDAASREAASEAVQMLRGNLAKVALPEGFERVDVGDVEWDTDEVVRDQIQDVTP